MKIHTPTSTTVRSGGCTRWLAYLGAFVAIVFAANVTAQAPAAPGDAAPERSAEELDKLVGRIALYPDDLVAIILPSATNPLQIVQADRFLDKRKTDPKAALDEKWDDAVKSLLNYPEVVKMMSNDLDWTSDLGEAVVEDQGAVLEAIQVFRRKTQAAGNLKTDDKQAVVVDKEVIKIVPANPEVIYVPQYNPSTVVVSGGYPYPYGYYPSPYPVYYYPYAPGAAFATGLIWGAAIGAAWNGGHYVSHYGGGGNNTINIDNSKNINRGGGSASQRPAGGGSGSSQWKSNKQPGQVSSSVGKTSSSARAGDARGGGAGGARASTQPAGGGAFGGSNASGRQTQMDSSRGASSRGSSPGAGAGAGSRPSPSMSGGGARPSPSAGGGARAGGGGGARAGGGGGRGGGGGGRR